MECPMRNGARVRKGDSMDWSKGYSARYYVSLVDRGTMRDLGTSRLDLSENRNKRRIEITGGSITRNLDSLRESASFDCTNYDVTGEQIIRIWLDARQNGDSSHIPLFTGLATSPRKDFNGRKVSNTVECYSVLKIADDILLDRGWYAPAEIDIPSLVKDLLSVIGVSIEISKVSDNKRYLTQNIVAESGETRLSMANTLLSIINWRLIIDGYGNIKLEPTPMDVDENTPIFSSTTNDVIELSFFVENDWYDCPNVFRAVMDDLSAEARDEKEDSPLSIKNRGREVWYEETDCYLDDNETLGEYAIRRLDELQRSMTTINYSRRFFPNLYPSDLVTLNFPAQRVQGLYRIESQSIELGYNAKTSEEVYLL